MLLEAPPSRYRVVERDGRLTVIDTQGAGPPRSARDLIARDAEARPMASLAPYPRESGDPEPHAAPPAILDSRVRGNTRAGWQPSERPAARQPRPDEPLPFLRRAAANMTGDVRDERGRLMLSTASWIDAKGPRDIALSPAGEQSLGAICLATIAGLILLVVLLIAFTDLMLPVMLLGVVALSQSRPFFTRAIDTLARL